MNNKHLWISVFFVLTLGVVFSFFYFTSTWEEAPLKWLTATQWVNDAQIENDTQIESDSIPREDSKSEITITSPEMLCQSQYMELYDCWKHYISNTQFGVLDWGYTLYTKTMEKMGYCSMAPDSPKECRETCDSQKNLCENIEVDCELAPDDTEQNASYNKSRCYSDMSQRKKDATFCNKIAHWLMRDGCYKSSLKYNNDIKNCELINSPEGERFDLKNGCYSDYFRSQTGSTIDTCENYTGNTKEYCLSNFAYKNKDLDICKTISTESIKDRCMNQFSNTSTDAAICDAMTTENIKDNCYLNIALTLFSKSKNSENTLYTFCENIASESLKDSCYSSYAQNTEKSLPFCKMIKTESLRDNCYNRYVRNSRDVSACTLIWEKTLRDYCTENYK